MTALPTRAPTLASLFRIPADRQHATPWLVALSATMLLRTVPLLLAFAGVSDQQGLLLLAPTDLTLLWGPLLWGYVQRLTNSPTGTTPAWHMIPTVVHVVYQLTCLLLPLDHRVAWYYGPHSALVAPAIAAAQLVSLSLYGFAAWTAYTRWREDEGMAPLSLDEPWRAWLLRALLGGIALAAVSSAIMLLVHLFVVPMIYLNRLPVAVGYAATSYLVTVVAARAARTHRTLRGLSGLPSSSPAPADTRVSPTRDYRQQAEQWRQRMLDEGWHRDPALTLGALASRLYTSERTLSRTLHEGLGLTFSSLVNSLRVEDAARQLSASEGRSVLEVAFAVGFSSKASFHRAFRRHLNRNPGDIRREPASHYPPTRQMAEDETTH